MKVCVLKIGGRISTNSISTSGANGEALSIIKMLTTAGIDVDVYTDVKKRDAKPEGFNIYEITEVDDINNKNYDCVLVVNGNPNFMGGTEYPSYVLSYKLFNAFKGKVFYCLCDPNQLLIQVWCRVKNKPWGHKYKEPEITVKRDDIVYITQARNTDTIQKWTKREHIDIKKVLHFPFENFVYLNTEPKEPVKIEDCKYDLIYGGTFREGRRKDDMVKYYFGHDFNVNMFGNFKDHHFSDIDIKHPTFTKGVHYPDYIDEMRKGIATVIICDEKYKQLDNLAQRIYESVLGGNVVFIDQSADVNRRVFGKSDIADFSYVNSKEDVQERIAKIKSEGQEFVDYIVNAQRKACEFDVNAYCEAFKNILLNA